MTTLRNLYLAVLAASLAALPVAAYTGYYAPVCGWFSVWSFSGHHIQYVCL